METLQDLRGDAGSSAGMMDEYSSETSAEETAAEVPLLQAQIERKLESFQRSLIDETYTLFPAQPRNLCLDSEGRWDS